MKITRVLGLVVTVVALVALSANAQNVDMSASSVKWTGYHLAKSYEHYGYVNIKSGEITIKDGKLTAGSIIIDMNSISNTDLTDEKKNKKLVKDLKSERFFNASEYPEASISISNVTAKANGEYTLTAEIQIRGIKQNINLDLTQSTTGGKVVFDGKLEIDRIKHEVMYGWSIENAMLSNNFDLEVHIVVDQSSM
jgi:polyisoprenoid-binding protein YceI